MSRENQTCDICEGPLAITDFEKSKGDRWFGYNPYPIRPTADYRCCKICDDEVVIPVRIMISQLERRRRRALHATPQS